MKNAIAPSVFCGAGLAMLMGLAACGGSDGGNGSDNPTPAVGGQPTQLPSENPNGNPSKPSGKTPNPTPSKAPTAAPSASPTASPNGLSAFEFTYEGIEGPIRGKVDREGHMTLDAWPFEFNPAVQIKTRPIVALSDEECAFVEKAAKTGWNTRVRATYGYTIAIEVLPTASATFINTAANRASVAMGGVGAPRFKDAPSAPSFKLHVRLLEGAMTAHLGRLDELEAKLSRLAYSPISTVLTGEIFTQDLLCDLRSGKAYIEFEVPTNKEGYVPQIRASRLVGPS